VAAFVEAVFQFVPIGAAARLSRSSSREERHVPSTSRMRLSACSPASRHRRSPADGFRPGVPPHRRRASPSPSGLHLVSWLARREAAERPAPGDVEDELRGYLECGLLCFGFARAACMSYRTGFVVAARLSRARQPWEPEERSLAAGTIVANGIASLACGQTCSTFALARVGRSCFRRPVRA
jgi:hypothetical protein